MNRTQWILALVGVTVVIVMLVVPPWVQVSRMKPEWGDASRGYHWRFEPPAAFGDSYFTPLDKVQINGPRLWTQVAIAAGFFGGLVFILRSRPHKEHGEASGAREDRVDAP